MNLEKVHGGILKFKRGIKFSLSDYWEIDNYCKELDIDWFVSCWDINSQIEMRVFQQNGTKLHLPWQLTFHF